eukprot:NODE_904_length_3225_cov_0.289827.p1 type:complete len:548 gc:universal NODE_904_length_3225_cov_0.289827:1869-226(-)
MIRRSLHSFISMNLLFSVLFARYARSVETVIHEVGVLKRTASENQLLKFTEELIVHKDTIDEIPRVAARVESVKLSLIDLIVTIQHKPLFIAQFLNSKLRMRDSLKLFIEDRQDLSNEHMEAIQPYLHDYDGELVNQVSKCPSDSNDDLLIFFKQLTDYASSNSLYLFYKYALDCAKPEFSCPDEFSYHAVDSECNNLAKLIGGIENGHPDKPAFISTFLANEHLRSVSVLAVFQTKHNPSLPYLAAIWPYGYLTINLYHLTNYQRNFFYTAVSSLLILDEYKSDNEIVDFIYKHNSPAVPNFSLYILQHPLWPARYHNPYHFMFEPKDYLYLMSVVRIKDDLLFHKAQKILKFEHLLIYKDFLLLSSIVSDDKPNIILYHNLNKLFTISGTHLFGRIGKEHSWQHSFIKYLKDRYAASYVEEKLDYKTIYDVREWTTYLVLVIESRILDKSKFRPSDEDVKHMEANLDDLFDLLIRYLKDGNTNSLMTPDDIKEDDKNLVIYLIKLLENRWNMVDNIKRKEDLRKSKIKEDLNALREVAQNINGKK